MPTAGNTPPSAVVYHKFCDIKKLAVATIRPNSELAWKRGPRLRIGGFPFDRYERELIAGRNRCRFCRACSDRRQAEEAGDECDASHSPAQSVKHGASFRKYTNQRLGRPTTPDPNAKACESRT